VCGAVRAAKREGAHGRGVLCPSLGTHACMPAWRAAPWWAPVHHAPCMPQTCMPSSRPRALQNSAATALWWMTRSRGRCVWAGAGAARGAGASTEQPVEERAPHAGAWLPASWLLLPPATGVAHRMEPSDGRAGRPCMWLSGRDRARPCVPPCNTLLLGKKCWQGPPVARCRHR